MQTGVALPLLEHELHLPAQPIGITNLLEGEIRARETGNEVAGSFVLCVPGHDQARLELLPDHLKIEGFVFRHLRLQALQRLVAEAFELTSFKGIGRADNGVDDALGLDDEVAAVGEDLSQIRFDEEHPIPEEQPSSHRVEGGDVMHLGLFVGGQWT